LVTVCASGSVLTERENETVGRQVWSALDDEADIEPLRAALEPKASTTRTNENEVTPG